MMLKARSLSKSGLKTVVKNLFLDIKSLELLQQKEMQLTQTSRWSEMNVCFSKPTPASTTCLFNSMVFKVGGSSPCTNYAFRLMSGIQK